MEKEINQSQNQIITQQNVFRKFVSNRNDKKTKVKMNQPIYLGMSILDISKTLIFKFWYHYFKLKYGDRAKLCYTDTDGFIIHIITEDFFEDISNDVEIWYDTSNYDKNDERPLPLGKNSNWVV